MEGLGLLLDRLFSIGYRRVEMRFDTLDFERGRLARNGLGMREEGTLKKSRISYGSSVDEGIAAMLNSDWEGGEKRQKLWKGVYGEGWLKEETRIEKRRKEVEENEEDREEKEKKEKKERLEKEEKEKAEETKKNM